MAESSYLYALSLDCLLIGSFRDFIRDKFAVGGVWMREPRDRFLDVMVELGFKDSTPSDRMKSLRWKLLTHNYFGLW